MSSSTREDEPAGTARCQRAVPPRVSERPDPRQWGEDELLTLTEAVALHWPTGPLTVATLRTAIRDGILPVAVVARRHLVTRRGIRAMSQTFPLPKSGRSSRSDTPADP